MRKIIAAVGVAGLLATAPAFAAIDNYVAFLYGSNEIPGPGDPDGFGTASVSIDNVANRVSWSILALNIDLPLTGAHIHQGGAAVAGPVIVSFSAQTLGEGLDDADLALITPGAAAGFYVNLHNALYPAGAIRGQLEYVGTATMPIPEPQTYAMMMAGIGLLGFVAVRRRQHQG
ncbi:MAG: CHRD domain-containing protein [Rubrivivax sp.]